MVRDLGYTGLEEFWSDSYTPLAFEQSMQDFSDN